MPPIEKKRRRVILLAGGMIFGSSGCLSNLESLSGRDDRSRSTTDNQKPILEYVVLSNHHSEPHAVTLSIERQSETVHEQTYHVPQFDADSDVAGTKIIEPPTFDRERGDWTVGATLDSGSEQTRLDLTDVPHEGGCINVTVRITEQGKLTALNDTPDCTTTEKK
ncbi:hypothetical protein [Halorussus ruber]|uniref:hypothetical protein n=1 Tax=Halorussus ruber TaxID=1126238 RepID=UPI001091BC05|nr:hypothetical protein [Halorussus ruber]